MMVRHIIILVVCDFGNFKFGYFFFFSETRDLILGFLREGRQRYPDLFNQVLASEPEASQVLNLL